ncbi:hypothetical protein JMJ35_001178 [Cladonia borealis]|uniref:Alpha-taxilin n=1 Tax=Cladonia borealis TaxID=184061 RepID=A0AA39RA15_9LECA|nr:hypothetical protein JMJ35_001178 [Cladonia borealis]
MARPTPQNPAASANAGSSPAGANNNPAQDYINGHGNLPDAPASNAVPAAPAGKKGKNKKATDPSETGKLLAAKISQLELETAGEKDQEAEIEREVKKATRDLSNLLTGMENPLSKIEAVQKKYTELLAEMKRVDRENMKNKKRSELLQKEKDQARSELSKTNSMKEKLEKLCRELQRDNKKLKDEQRKLEDSEKRSREDLSERAESLFIEINEAMDRSENPESQKSNLEVDELFRQKFRSFVEQYELRELHFMSLMRTKECEIQLSQARAEDHRKRAEAEATKSRQLSSQVSTFTQTESELRSQLNIYVEKFKQVEDTLNNSNDLFLTFRKEMEEMSKKTKRLEKENLNLTRKHDLTNRNILEMAEERTKVNQDLEKLRKKNSTLESVIRRMQDQGRAPAGAGALEGDEEGTESDYEEEEDYDDEEGSEEGEYDDDTEEEALQQAQVGALPTFGPVPPPPPSSQAQINGKVNGEVNGVKSIAV